MHVLQWIAVRDESKEDAFDSVKLNLESYLEGGIWYDWFVTGGGRWNPNPEAQYNENDLSMAISLEEDGIDKFKARVDECLLGRIREFNDYRQQYEERAVDIQAKLDSFNGYIDYSFDLYPMGKMIDMLQGEWDFNSYFFDMETHSTNPKHMLDKIASGEVNWYLIPVDFHF